MTSNKISEISSDMQRLFKERKSVITFGAFLELVKENPRCYVRNSAEYLRDCFDFYGATAQDHNKKKLRRFRLFDIGTERGVPIVGGEVVQNEIYRCLQAFIRQDSANKVIFLHGPNGSAKSSSIEAISRGMQKYSESEEGAVYRFSWIFPIDKGSAPRSVSGESSPIGFSPRKDESKDNGESFALLDDSQIASKLQSEFKENPLYLIPPTFREELLREWIAKKEQKRLEDVQIPQHILLSGLSKKNQLIFENLLNAYGGELEKVYRHIQVERFFYSRQYRVGISTVEPQMSIDAQEKQLTMDKNLANLPSVLHNIRFTEVMGEIVEANRGILEFSDILKRPLEAFKYLLTTVERATLTLPTATQYIDIVFFATANDKHLDAFKQTPDFSSFRGRFDFLTVPYLLRLKDERRIYEKDIAAIKRTKNVAPHSLDALCLWAIMTRLKQPDPEAYDSTQRGLVSRLDPFSKARLYNGDSLGDAYSPADQIALQQMVDRVSGESIGSVVYEGRFGASPREVKALLYRIAENPTFETMTPMAIFSQLELLIKDRSTYEYLQFEARNKYHDAAFFIKNIRDDFALKFETEVLMAMTLIEEKQHDKLLAKYIENAVAFVKKENLFNRKTENQESPSEILMKDVESILGVSGDPIRFRESLLSRIAGYRIENKDLAIDFSIIFSDHLQRLKDHYYEQQSANVQKNLTVILALGSGREMDFDEKQRKLARLTLDNLASNFGYDEVSARECVKFLISHKRG
jgi:serine protein kinase